ncbi:MAG: chromate efflux transporter [Pseudomonadota bacterium]
MSRLDTYEKHSNARPDLTQTVRVWLRIGLLSFGGPAAQIALMHREVVEQRRWLSEQQYLTALSFCMLLPGPEAMQLATYAGWRLHGLLGGLIAGLLFVIPGAIVVFALASVYALFGGVPLIDAVFIGIKAAVIAIVLEALFKVSKRALILPEHWVIAALAFVGIFFFAVPFPLIIFAAAIFGYLRTQDTAENTYASNVKIKPAKTLAIIFAWLLIWWFPIAALGWIFEANFLFDIGVFFSKLAVVTFGGAYAVLAYLAQDVVSQFGWLTATEMMDGLGLAETTPGPLILVNEFVGFIAGYREGGFALASAAALVTLWTTFVPCFLWIFAGAPYLEWLDSQPRLKGALAAITAAVVGVILYLSIWFALHVFFSEVSLIQYGVLSLWVPAVESVGWLVVILFSISALLLFFLKFGVFKVLLVSSALGLMAKVLM